MDILLTFGTGKESSRTYKLSSFDSYKSLIECINKNPQNYEGTVDGLYISKDTDFMELNCYVDFIDLNPSVELINKDLLRSIKINLREFIAEYYCTPEQMFRLYHLLNENPNLAIHLAALIFETNCPDEFDDIILKAEDLSKRFVRIYRKSMKANLIKDICPELIGNILYNYIDVEDYLNDHYEIHTIDIFNTILYNFK